MSFCLFPWFFFQPSFFFLSFFFLSYSSLILEQPDNTNDTTESGNFVIPEISVTNVAGERTRNGEKNRIPGDSDQHIQGVQEIPTEPRVDSKSLPEIRRQKSVRKIMEDGLSSPGRMQF